MSCACAERMRRLLRRLGYTLRDETWLAPDQSAANPFAQIPDVEVAQHHGRLVAHLAVSKTTQFLTGEVL